ncbi:hypothetical protein KOAAANKH_02110 [Brevundimonas sp. NIBR10]|uniref:Hpt domain-containing protein n=1 Tax=Brevundimonas sp. NIBR10 TaxID=3015997 RepID=UPI0022F183FF|nr:Hpt domain-containing protein [Brevundimonas sp. NIBR10]WGM47235.1 hypothetical protein KOAAANKH_02110 [Brevundimonas sp. NIBR10]
MTDPLAALRARFRDRALADREALEFLARENLASDELRRLVHNLAGTAGTFGYRSLSEAAMEIDDQMASGMAADPASMDRLKAGLNELAQSPE